MTSPYYNHPLITNANNFTQPEYDTCSACGCDDKPTTSTMIDEEVIINCNDCLLTEYSETI